MTTIAMTVTTSGSLSAALSLKCPPNSLPCRNSTQCYRTLWACDGIRDCPLADDELGCYQPSNQTMDKETVGCTSEGGGEATVPGGYRMKLGFFIFVIAGGLLFTLFLWWLCNISVHKRRGVRRRGGGGHGGHSGGRSSTSCMDAIFTDFKGLSSWKTDLYDPEDHPGYGLRSTRVDLSTSLAGRHQSSRVPFCSGGGGGGRGGTGVRVHGGGGGGGGRWSYRLAHHHPPSSSSSSSSPSSRCAERLQDQLFMSVDEIGVLSSPARRAHPPPHRSRPVLSISRPPSYNSCLNHGHGQGQGQDQGQGQGGGQGCGGCSGTVEVSRDVIGVGGKDNVIGDAAASSKNGDVARRMTYRESSGGGLSWSQDEEDAASGDCDVLPSYDDVTKGVVGGPGVPPALVDRLPSYPPGYREAIGSE